MRREIPLPVAIGVIVVVLLVAIGAYLVLGRPKSGTAPIRMNPHAASKLFPTGKQQTPQQPVQQPLTPK